MCKNDLGLKLHAFIFDYSFYICYWGRRLQCNKDLVPVANRASAVGSIFQSGEIFVHIRSSSFYWIDAKFHRGDKVGDVS